MRGFGLSLALVFVGLSASGCASLRDYFGFERAAPPPPPVVRVAPARNLGPVAAPSTRVEEAPLDAFDGAVDDALLLGGAQTSARAIDTGAAWSSAEASAMLLGGADDVRPATCSTDAGRMIVVAPGDTLSGIAMRELGDYNQLDAIIRLNLDRLPDPDRISPGLALRLPGDSGTLCRPA